MTTRKTDTAEGSSFDIRFPSASTRLDQDKEIFEFREGGQTRRLRIHDYTEIYSVPGLYEALVYEKLQCNSPQRLAELVDTVLVDWPRDPKDLRVLDLGAGNGIVAEELRRIGVGHIVGVDLLPEAEMAAARDRPGAYDDYIVGDLLALERGQSTRLREAKLNFLITVAALGFGDIPPDAFAAAVNFIEKDGWIAMTIKEDFLDPADQSGFSRLMRRIIDLGILEIQAHHRFCHRLSIEGEQLFYYAIVARKSSDIGPEILAGLEEDLATGAGHPSTLLLGGA